MSCFIRKGVNLSYIEDSLRLDRKYNSHVIRMLVTQDEGHSNF
jgi:hypothetical protein